MKTLYLLRGLPGAGKSTLAKSIGVVYFEADMFFMVGNEYKFDMSKIKDAHAWCQDQVRTAMKNADAGIGDTRIAVANTFTQECEMKAYTDMATEYGFTVFSIIVESRHKSTNIHGVPADVLDRMEERFELKLR